jgi:hypothetical protein
MSATEPKAEAPAPPTIADLQGRLSELTTRCHAAEAEAKSLSENAKRIQAVRREFSTIADLTDPRIIAIARQAYETALRVESEIQAMEPGVKYSLDLQREFHEAWASAWADCEAMSGVPADEWHEGMVRGRDRFRTWREETLKRLQQGERRWLAEQPKGEAKKPA